MAGRHVRTIIGSVVILVQLAGFVFQHVIFREDYNWPELATNGALLIVGLLLVDRNSGLEVLGAVKERIPLIGKPKA